LDQILSAFRTEEYNRTNILPWKVDFCWDISLKNQHSIRNALYGYLKDCVHENMAKNEEHMTKMRNIEQEKNQRRWSPSHTAVMVGRPPGAFIQHLSKRGHSASAKSDDAGL